MLEAEISSIYKKNGSVRKVHSLVYVPDFESAERLCSRLEQIGNLAADGRPILGLDVRHLLELVLEIPRAYMIPAHIWTPGFRCSGPSPALILWRNASRILRPTCSLWKPVCPRTRT